MFMLSIDNYVESNNKIRGQTYVYPKENASAFIVPNKMIESVQKHNNY